MAVLVLVILKLQLHKMLSFNPSLDSMAFCHLESHQKSLVLNNPGICLRNILNLVLCGDLRGIMCLAHDECALLRLQNFSPIHTTITRIIYLHYFYNVPSVTYQHFAADTFCHTDNLFCLCSDVCITCTTSHLI